MNNLPKGWNLLALNQICDLQNGYAFKSSDYVNISNTLNCRMSNIRPNGVFDLEHNQKFLPDTYTEKYKQYLLKDGDVIIAMTDMATEAKILGVPTIVKTQGKNLLLNQRVGKLVIKKPELIYFPYLKYVLNREQVKKYFLKFAGGGLQINLGKDDILSVTIPLPPLEEQKRIAEILDQAEELRRKRREAIAQLDTLTQSIFIEMFGDPVKNPKNIKTLPLAKVCKRITDGTHQPPKWSTSGYPFLFVSNIVSGEINFDTVKFISSETHEELTRRCPIEFGDVLYSTVGSYGVPVIVKTQRKFAFQRHIAHIKPDLNLIDSQFLCAMLASPALKRQADRSARGIAQKTVNLEEIRKFIIILPPLSLQKEFAQRVEAVEELKKSHRASLSELDALFASLQHRAFKGEL